MNIRKLKKDLGRGSQVQRAKSAGGSELQVQVAGASFRVDERSGWREDDLAAYLKSKVPALAIKPQ